MQGKTHQSRNSDCNVAYLHIRFLLLIGTNQAQEPFLAGPINQGVERIHKRTAINKGVSHMFKTILTLTAVIMLTLVPAAWGAAGNTPVGIWSGDVHNDEDSNFVPIGIQGRLMCFQPDGIWYMIDDPAIKGRWFQKGISGAGNGNHVRILGHGRDQYGTPGGSNQTAEVSFIHNDLMTGHAIGWVDNNGDILLASFGTIELHREADDQAACPTE
jgi:hypothetical protein